MQDMAPKQVEEIEELRDDVKKILYILESNDKLGQEGLVNKVNRIDKTLSDWLVEYKVIKAKAAAYGVMGGGIISIIIYAVKGFIMKIMVAMQ